MSSQHSLFGDDAAALLMRDIQKELARPWSRYDAAPDKNARFDGETYSAEHDEARLTGQMQRVYALMSDGEWRTLDEIELETGDTPQSISARLRDLRKEKFGSLTVERRARGDRAAGCFEYRVVGTP